MLRKLALVLGVIVAFAWVTPVAQAGPTPAPAGNVVAWDDRTGAQLEQWECEYHHVCFWPEPFGMGSRCMWDVSDPDWTQGDATCSWATVWNVKSVMNLKPKSSNASQGVVYYKKANQQDRAGCTRPEHGGNLAGTYKLRSHRWEIGRCG
ncbi:hypothetical protein FKR81_20550 [Lentzea tibetensis]|uniref:Peptidase inhibitor family I36 n=2 Tax=Lentzea tibetensis TaxID=2591470 RepID=A0A563ESG1_9PSEU|nr:hypothetical protein FKR81_20550 [Lentzea tibetensis]